MGAGLKSRLPDRFTVLPAVHLHRPNVAVRIYRAADLEVIGAAVVAALSPGCPGDPVIPAAVSIQQPELDVPVAIALDPLFGRTLACGDRIVAAGVAISRRLILSLRDLHAPNSAIGQVHGARKTVRVAVAVVAPAHIEGAHDSVVAARVVIRIQVPEIDVAEAVPLIRSLPDGILAGVRAVVRCPPAISAAQWLARGTGTEAFSAPHQVEGVALGAAIGILDPYDSRAAAARWVLEQLLFSAAIDAPKPKLTWIRGHRPGTLEPAPLRRLSG